MPEKGTNQPDQIRAELQRILAFKDMKSSRQLSRFLEFVVEESLAGRESRIKERTIAIGALERDEDFDPRFDAIVRIVAGKLRRTIDRYYQSDGASDELRITIPKGAYVPRVLTREEAMQTAPAVGTPVAIDPIVQTKLYRPPVTPDLVRLPALLERLKRYRTLPLIVVSAPAGYGKTTLLSAWLDECEVPAAWLSLDEDDNDPRRFLGGIVAALETIHPAVARDLADLLETPKLPPMRTLGHRLLNDVAAIEGPFVLVLDDYHFIHERAVQEFVGELLEHPLQQLQVVILTRSDPSLPLDRLRARGAVVDLSMFDLQFTPAETAEFLAKTLDVPLSDSDAESISTRMEGWPAGLRLLAHSLRHHRDPKEAISKLEGDLSAVTGYLVAEILSQLPPAITTCLINVSIVDRFCEPLCEALGEEGHGAAISACGGVRLTDWLHDRNLFLISMDAEHHWYRFHHLFRELLLKQLKERVNGREMGELHARASTWFESSGLTTEAIQHLVAAGDAAGAADIVERHRRAELDKDRWSVISKWLDMLPGDVKRHRPALLLADAWTAQVNWRLEDIPPLLDQAEALLTDQPDDKALAGELRFFRGFVLYCQGDVQAARTMLEEAHELAAGAHELIQGESALHLALARQATGQEKLAIEMVEDELRAAAPEAHLYRSRLTSAPVFIHLISGNLVAADRAVQRFASVVRHARMPYAIAWAHYMQGVTRFHRDDPAGASEAFALAAEDRDILHHQAALDAMAGLAMSYQFMQRSDHAADAMEQMLLFAQGTSNPEHILIAESCRARLSLMSGDLDSAMAWAASLHVHVDVPSMLMWMEIPALTQARVLIAAGSDIDLDGALESLDHIRQGAEAIHFTAQAIEIAVLQSAALEKRGRADDALVALQHALALAEPRGWIRPFVEIGPLMADLLSRLVDRGLADSSYVHDLLARLAGPGEHDEGRSRVVDTEQALDGSV